MMRSSLPFCISAKFSVSSTAGRGIKAGSTSPNLFSPVTSGNGTLDLESNERRGDLVLAANKGVIGGVVGSFDRLIAVAPMR